MDAACIALIVHRLKQLQRAMTAVDAQLWSGRSRAAQQSLTRRSGPSPRAAPAKISVTAALCGRAGGGASGRAAGPDCAAAGADGAAAARADRSKQGKKKPPRRWTHVQDPTRTEAWDGTLVLVAVDAGGSRGWLSTTSVPPPRRVTGLGAHGRRAPAPACGGTATKEGTRGSVPASAAPQSAGRATRRDARGGGNRNNNKMEQRHSTKKKNKKKRLAGT